MRLRWVLVAAVLALGACGGGSKHTPVATPAATHAAASPDCAKLEQVGVQVASALQGATGAGADKAKRLLDELAGSAPAEIRDDIKEIAAAYRQIVTALNEAGGVQAGTTPSPEALAKLQQVLSQIDEGALRQANQHVTDWVSKHC